MGNFKFSLFNFEFQRGGRIAVYNSISMRAFYMDPASYQDYRDLKEKGIEKAIQDSPESKRKDLSQMVDFLSRKGFLIDQKVDEIAAKKRITQQVIAPSERKLEVMYLFPTDDCNLRCKYCVIETDFQRRHSRMEKSTAEKSLDFFVENSRNSDNRTIIIYGGEPLREKDLVKHILDYYNKKYGDIKTNLHLLTNGTLVDTAIADYLGKQNIAISVSLDGKREVHDSARGRGSFDDAVRGYKLLRERGCNNLGISFTVGKHNVEKLREHVKYLANKLNPRVIGLNILIDLTNRVNPMHVSEEYVADKVIEAFDFLRTAGIPEERLLRRVKAFVEGKYYMRDCAASNQIAVSPEGDVGMCHAFIPEKRYFFGNIHDKDLSLKSNPFHQEWKTSCHFYRESCYDCSAIAICGGGCPYQAFVSKGSINALDTRNCILNKRLLEWMLWNSDK